MNLTSSYPAKIVKDAGSRELLISILSDVCFPRFMTALSASALIQHLTASASFTPLGLILQSQQAVENSVLFSKFYKTADKIIFDSSSSDSLIYICASALFSYASQSPHNSSEVCRLAMAILDRSSVKNAPAAACAVDLLALLVDYEELNLLSLWKHFNSLWAKEGESRMVMTRF